MQIHIHGEMSLAEIRQAIFEMLSKVEVDFSVRYSRGAMLVIRPSNGFGDKVRPCNATGQQVTKLHSRGPYRAAADHYDP